jgi:predicted RNA binding protein YcfA (HicA-like mRNA interferase family)
VKAVSGKRMCKILEGRGWQFLKIRGSHHHYINTQTRVLVAVPVHGNHDLKPATQKGIMRRAGLTDADL